MKYLLSSCVFLSIFFAGAQDNIRLNQLGFLPESQKIAIIVDSDQTTFEIVNKNDQVVYSGSLGSSNYWNNSMENVQVADFSEFKKRGNYRIKLSNGSFSHAFKIQDDVFNSVSKGSVKAYYFNRASMALDADYAGDYARQLGHPDNSVIVLPSAASAERPAGTIISTPKGWYDAGDYNKYVVNSGISTFTLLSAYERFPSYYDELDLNIPESSNDIPDILDEALWNIEWLATMQDTDGGVYNKTTHANFQGAVMPHQASSQRYVVAKGTAATLDFAGVLAQASRIYAPYMPEVAATWLTQAEHAWQWAQTNNNVPFNNPPAQNGYPAVNTGGYGDGNFKDEFFWAASELFITTSKVEYYNSLDFSVGFGNPGWPNVQTLGILSMITNRKSLDPVADTTKIKKALFDITNGLVNYQKSNSPYRIPNNSFYWGSNSEPGNQAMLLLHAYELTKDVDYFNAALGGFDYLLGRNATTFSFVTGFGTKTPQNIHHRQSEADDIAAPVPGFLAGGPNPHNTSDDCGSGSYPSLTPAKCYLDDWCSYSTNEITINWNAPLVFAAGAIDYIYARDFLVPDTTSTVLGSIKREIDIFPNPANDTFEIRGVKGDINVGIFNLSGSLVGETTGQLVDITRIPKGTYLVIIQSKEVSTQKKLLVR